MFVHQSRHIDSYYAGTTTPPVRASLDGDIDTEILVVGAGFAGLHTALRLALAGKRVTVIEASRVAWAASGRNGGMAILGWSCDMPPLEAELGREGAKRLWDLVRWAAGEVRSLPQRHGFECDYREGHLWTSTLQRRVSGLREWQHEACEKWGYDRLQFIERAELAKWVGTERYHAGLFDPEGAHFNPLKMALGIATAIEQAGGCIFEQTRAVSYRQVGDRVEVITERGTVRCDRLVLACNAYLDQLDSDLSRRVLPVGTFMVATEQLDASRAESLIPSDSCVTDNQFVLDYFRRSPDNRLLFGGGCTYLGGVPKDIGAMIRPRMEKVFPNLQGVKLDYTWGGHIDISMRRTPNIGCRGPVYWLLGFSGHGVLPTCASARAVSDAILGQPDDLELFQRLHHPKFPGPAWLAPTLEAVGKAYYRIRDLF